MCYPIRLIGRLFFKLDEWDEIPPHFIISFGIISDKTDINLVQKGSKAEKRERSYSIKPPRLILKLQIGQTSQRSQKILEIPFQADHIK